MKSSSYIGKPTRGSKHFLLCNLSSIFLIVAGTIAEGVIMNPIILGIIPGSGLIIKTLK